MRFGERFDQIARFQFGRVEDHLLARLLELGNVVATDVLILDRQYPGFLPLAERPELHVPDYSAEARLMQMRRDLFLVEAAGGGYSRPQKLHCRIGKRCQEIAERVDPGAGCALLI